MLSSIALKFTENEGELQIPSNGVTIFVGPNNSGKSLLLREIEGATLDPSQISRMKILSGFDIEWPIWSDVETLVEPFSHLRPSRSENFRIGRYQRNDFEDRELNPDNLRQLLRNKENKDWILHNFIRFFTIRLDGRTRFELTQDKEMGDLLGHPRNIFAYIFTRDEIRKKIREYIFDALGQYFVIDPTMGSHLRIRLSQTPPTNEQSLDRSAREFHSAATHISEASDGVQAYVGILTTVLAGSYRLFLIDEPEAFLHPPLSRKLGYQLSKIVAERQAAMFVSTHSADFVIGCIQANVPVRIVRLEYSDGKSNGTLVNTDFVNLMFKRPLMRSTNVLSSLFHDGVVVTESDNDRVFYSEIYQRLSESEGKLPSLLFVNAQNKTTLRDIMGPLRKFGIPTAAIPDIDIVKRGGADWRNLLEAAHIPTAALGSLAVQRDSVAKIFDAAGVDMKIVGVSGLGRDDQRAANLLFDILERYGVFVVRRGVLEKWLPELGVAGEGTRWTVAMLERLGSDPARADYVRSGPGDVWEFVRGIVRWVENPARAGTE